MAAVNLDFEKLSISGEEDGTPPLNLRIRTMGGTHQSVSVSPNASRFELLTQLVELGIAPPGSSLLWFRSSGTVRLDDNSSLIAQGVRSKDEILVLIPHKAYKSPVTTADADDMVITEELIADRTSDIPQSDPTTRTGISVRQSQPSGAMPIMDVVTNLYKISRTLRQALETDNGGPASPSPLAKPSPEEEDPYKDVDPEALMMLGAMGFSEERSKKALVLSGMQVESAMEWLISHEGDADIDKPLLPPPKSLKTTTGSTFTPCPVAYRTLTSMGFTEKDIIASLQLARNNVSTAAEHLLSGHDVHAALALKDKNAMDMNSPIMQEVLKDAHVQARLVDPRVWQALEAFHENPQRGSQYLSDPVIGSIIVFLSQLIQRVESGAS